LFLLSKGLKLINKLMIGLGKALAAGLKSLVDHQQSVKNKSSTIKTSWPVCRATSSKDRWIGAYSIGLTILGKLDCPIKKKDKKRGLKTCPI
jgi:hypothetical protein